MKRQIVAFTAGILSFAGCRSKPPTIEVAAPSLERCDLPQDSVRYHFVIDRSGSMRDEWPQVLEQLDAMAVELSKAPGAILHVEAFSGSVLTPIRNQRIVGGADSTIRNQLRQLRAPLGTEPTDIGKALETAANEIEVARSDGMGRVTFLLVITDGAHEPQGGKYVNDAHWEALRDRWRKLIQRRDMDIVPIVIPIGHTPNTGSDTVAWTVETATVMPPVQPAALGDAIKGELRKAITNIRYARVNPEVRMPRLTARFADSVQEVGYSGPTSAQAWIVSRASCVTYSLRGAAVPVQLRPGDSATVEIPISSTLPLAEALPFREGKQVILKGEAGEEVGQPLHITFHPRDELTKLIVPADDSTWTPRPTGVIRMLPLSRWWILAPLFALLAVLGLGWFARRPPLPGTLEPVGRGRAASAPGIVLDPANAFLLKAPPHAGTGGVLITFEKKSAFSRGQVAARVSPQGEVRAAVGTVRQGSVQLTPLEAGRELELPQDGYIIWQKEAGAGWPASLTEVEMKTNYAGFQWEPAAREPDVE